MRTPTAQDWTRLYRYALAWGVNARAAWGYATLMWWGMHYGIEPARIVSGLRDGRRQDQLRREWEQYGSSGPNRLVVAPAANSAHVTGDAWDVADNGYLHVYGAWAAHAGIRWGGTFRTPDRVHFDTRV